MLGEVEGRSPVLYPDSAEATAGATARGLVDLIVVDVGDGGPSVCSGRDGLRQRLAFAAARGVAKLTRPQAWLTQVWSDWPSVRTGNPYPGDGLAG